MSSRRIAKVAEALRETISTAVLFGIKDPRVKNVTVLRTEVSPDLKSARVYVTVMGDEKAQSLAMHGLRSARGYVQSQIAERLDLRYTPILTFILDPGVKKSIEAATIIREALATAVSPAEGDAEPGLGQEAPEQAAGSAATGMDADGMETTGERDGDEPAALADESAAAETAGEARSGRDGMPARTRDTSEH